MLPKLSERAGARCTAHIRRFYPDWMQAEILNGGMDSESQAALKDMRDFIAACKAHLSDLREQIAEGGTPCIDSGWPVLGETVDETPEPEIIEKVVEKIVEVEVPVEVIKEVEVEKVVYRDAPKTNLERAIDDNKKQAPPEAIADLFDPNLTARQNQEALTKKYAHHMSEYTRLRDYGDTDSRSQAADHLAKAERYESGINWNRPRLAEVVG